MAVYKVIQDIEAEDKLLGPLTLKGFIYAVTAGFLVFLNIRIAIASAGGGYRFIAILFLIWPTILFGILASPLGREQPTEVWLLSHIMFFLKPRTRLWVQRGPVTSVTITAPKKVELPIKHLSQDEIHSRLETLALTMDSRGWAVKNAYPSGAKTSPPPFSHLNAGAPSDRLVNRRLSDANSISDVHPSEDVLDLENSPRAQQVENLLQQKTIEQREKRLAELDAVKRQPAAPPAPAKSAPQPPVKSDSTTAKPQPPVPNSTLQDLSKSGSDISVASISTLANHTHGPGVTQISPNEVEIRLH